MITFKQKGDFNKTNMFIERLLELFKSGSFDKYGIRGVEALQAATPVDTGKTASSWDYVIKHDRRGVSLIWTNSNLNEGYNIAILIQYGHAQGHCFIKGVDYINPAMKHVFEEIAEDAWKEVLA